MALPFLLGVNGAVRLAARSRAAAVTVLVACGFVLQLAIHAFAFAPLGAVVRSDRANGFYGPATSTGIAEYLSSHSTPSRSLPDHARTNMPGKFVATRMMMWISRTPATLGVLVALLSCLGAVAVYLVARELEQDPRAALLAGAAYLLMPGRIAFLGIMNSVTPLVALGAFWLFLRCLRRPTPGASVAFGAGMFALAFFEPLPYTMGLVFVAALAQKSRASLRTYVKPALLAIVCAAFLYLALRLTLGYDIFANLAYVYRDAGSFNAAGRPYGVWVGANLIELALAAGVPAATVLPLGFASGEWRRWRVPANWFAAATLVTIIVVDLLGFNRGEVSRLWIFLSALVAIVAGVRMASARSLTPFALLAVAMAAQAAVMVGMIAFVIP